MKKLLVILPTIFFVTFLLFSCGDSSTSKGSSTKTTSINGTYKYSDSSFEIEIRVTGDSFFGSHRVITGMGSQYDPTERYSGSVRGNDLIDGEYGVRLGTVSGNTLRFTAPTGSTITLSKQ